MNFIAKSGCGFFILLITVTATFTLDLPFDPRFEYEWSGTCLNGQLQSPIVIPKTGRTYLSHLNLEFKNFNKPIKQVTVTNGARQTVFEWDRSEVERSVIVRGPAEKVAPFKANTEYILQNFHVHHGKNNCSGTMHSVDGSFYDMEMHFLFVLRQFDGNIGAGFTALGNTLEIVVLWRVSSVRNPSWFRLNNLMFSAKLKENQKVTGPVNIRLAQLMPRKSRFTLYHGSLPSSHCLEVITWIIFDTIMEFDTLDLAMRYFTYISDGKEILLERNTRSIQSLNGRAVYEGLQENVYHDGRLNF